MLLQGQRQQAHPPCCCLAGQLCWRGCWAVHWGQRAHGKQRQARAEGGLGGCLVCRAQRVEGSAHGLRAGSWQAQGRVGCCCGSCKGEG